MRDPSLECSSSVGLASTSGAPKSLSEGPIARIRDPVWIASCDHEATEQHLVAGKDPMRVEMFEQGGRCCWPKVEFRACERAGGDGITACDQHLTVRSNVAVCA
jgi:hypothetical protein